VMIVHKYGRYGFGIRGWNVRKMPDPVRRSLTIPDFHGEKDLPGIVKILKVLFPAGVHGTCTALLFFQERGIRRLE
jgi:hypothetical protein